MVRGGEGRGEQVIMGGGEGRASNNGGRGREQGE